MTEHTDRHFDALSKAVSAWLRLNGISPSETPREARATLVDGQLTIQQYVNDPVTGARVLDPEEPNAPKTRWITVPIKVAPTPLVREWLEPRCPKCGR